MSGRIWKRFAWIVAALVVAILLAALARGAWGDYRLWQVRENAGDYLADLYPQAEFADDEVNGSHVLDAAETLARLAYIEGARERIAFHDTPAFDQLARLVRSHRATIRAAVDADTPEALSQVVVRTRGLPAVGLLGRRRAELLAGDDRAEAVRVLSDQLALAEWMLNESPLILSQNLGLTATARSLASLGEADPRLLLLAPPELLARLERLSRVEVAASIRAERAYVLATSPPAPQGGILEAILRLPGTLLAPDLYADHAESLGKLAQWLEDPPYLRPEPPTGGHFHWLMDSLRETAAGLEAHVVQVQVAEAAAEYLHACAGNTMCPATPTVRSGDRVLAVDPFTGDSWRWQPAADGCVLYSTGPDREDDGGKLYTGGKIDKPGIDIGWTLPCGETRPAFKDLAPTTAPDSLGSS